MKTHAIRSLRDTLASDPPAYGLWVTLEAPSVTEMAVALGVDWVVIDAEHGHLDWHDIAAHVRAAVRSDTVVLVRIAELQRGLVKRVLDIGADGIVVPSVESAEELERAVAFARYPPDGMRGIGAERATAWGQCIAQHAAEANDHVLVVPIVESLRGARSIDALCAVPGVEIFFLGPADFSATAGYAGQWEGPGVAEQLLVVKDAVRRHGKHCGVVATSDSNLVERRQEGFTLLAVGIDGPMLASRIQAALAHAGQPRRFDASLAPPRRPRGSD